MQVQCRRPHSYLSSIPSATDISPSHRASVVDNMTGTAARLGLSADSLHRGVDLLDRFLASHLCSTPLHLLQPAGIACLWIGAKLEQCCRPAAGSFAQLILGPSGQPLGDTAPARQLLVLLEQRILKVLNYRLACGVSSRAFTDNILQHLCQRQQQHHQQQQQEAGPAAEQLELQQLQHLCCYLSEVALLEYNLLPWLPSQVAAASFGFAQVLLGMRLDLDLLQQLSGHCASELQGCMEYLCALHSTLAAAAALGTPYAVSVKYSGPQTLNVAAVAPISSSADARLHCTVLAHTCTEAGPG